MPRFNNTGPRGMGPMTGRGRGSCVATDTGDDPSRANLWRGRLSRLCGRFGRWFGDSRPQNIYGRAAMGNGNRGGGGRGRQSNRGFPR